MYSDKRSHHACTPRRRGLEKPLLNRITVVSYATIPMNPLDRDEAIKIDVHVSPLDFFASEQHLAVIHLLSAATDSYDQIIY